MEFGDLATGGKDHIQKHMNTQREIPESLRARTITHCPPPPPHSGKDITAAQMGRPIQTQNHHSHPLPLLRIHLPSCFFLLLFLLRSFSLSLSVAFLSFFFFFKLVYRTRREAACGKELSLLSFDDVICVVVPQRTFFLRREKKPAVSSLFSFCSLFVSRSFSCFL